MHFVWCIVCLLFCCSFNSAGGNLQEYYRLIYLAESNLCRGDYNAAFKHYRSAFKTRPPFYADLRNAFKTSLLSKDSVKISYFWLLIKEQPDLVKDLKGNDLILNLCPASIQSEITDYRRQRNNTSIESILDSIRIVDQQARNECSNNLKAECKEWFCRTDSANIKHVASLLNETIYSEVHGERMLEVCFLVAWHARRWGFTDLDQVLNAYVEKGWAKPAFLAQLIEYRSDIDSVNKRYLNDQADLGYGATTMVINNHLIEMNQTDSLIKVINENRRRYYLDRLEMDINKNALLLQNALFKGRSADFNIELFRQGMPEEEYKIFLSDLTQKGAVKKLWF